jgi:hypothetical protein
MHVGELLQKLPENRRKNIENQRRSLIPEEWN